ncbi:MAG TPA: hypothetical protein VE988_11485 [Gemmataceae bacterium]|nr:hypothetical protein [Gemmataceae bacterium]
MKNPVWFAAVVSLAACLTSCSPAVADVIGFWPRRDLDVRVRFENLSDYPNHDFYLKYGLGSGNPNAGLHLTRIQPDSVTRLEGNGSRATELYLLAVPRGQKVEQPPTGPDNRKWLTTSSNGAALQSWPFPDMQLEDLNGYTLVFRVRIDQDRLEVTLVRSQAPIPWTWIGVATSLGIAVAGIVWIRRFRRAKRLGKPSPD